MSDSLLNTELMIDSPSSGATLELKCVIICLCSRELLLSDSGESTDGYSGVEPNSNQLKPQL